MSECIVPLLEQATIQACFNHFSSVAFHNSKLFLSRFLSAAFYLSVMQGKVVPDNQDHNLFQKRQFGSPLNF